MNDSGSIEKAKIADYFLTGVLGAVRLDISTNEEDRIYGNEYKRILSEATLSIGAEAGTNSIEFEQKAYTNYKDFTKPIDYSTVKINKEPYNYRNLSPRIFENIAFGVINILYEGSYSGILIPWRHYLPLNRNHSNINEIITFLSNDEYKNQLVITAKKDIIQSGNYSYKKFQQLMIDHIEGVSSITKDRLISLAKDNSFNKSKLFISFYFLYRKSSELGILFTKRVIKRILSNFF